MGYPLTVTLPDELHRPLVQVASEAGQTPEEWVAMLVRRRLPRHDTRLRRHFGAVNPPGGDLRGDLVMRDAGGGLSAD